MKNKFGKKSAKKHRQTFVFSGLSVSNLKRTQRIWAKVTSILLFHLFFTIYFLPVGYVSLKMSIFVQKQKQIFQQILTLPSPFSPVREQIFSEILRKKSFSKVKNKSITFQKEKITCQLTVQFTSAKVMNITAVTKKISQKFNFTGKCLFLQQCINQAVLQ